MPAPLAEDARAYLKAQGAPISKFNLDNAMQELTNDPSLRPSYSSENQMISAMGGSTGTPDTSKYPGMKPQAGSNIGQFANDKDFTDPSYEPGQGSFTADSQFGSGRKPTGGQGGTAVREPDSKPPIKTTDLDPPAQTPTQQTQSDYQQARPSPSPRRREPPTLPVPHQANRPPSGPAPSAPPSPDPALVAAAQPPGGLNPVGAADLSSGIGAYNPAVGQTAQGLPPSPSAGGGMIDSLMGMLPEGTGERAQNVLSALGPIGLAMLGARGGAKMMGGRPAPGPTMRPPGVAGVPGQPVPSMPMGRQPGTVSAAPPPMPAPPSMAAPPPTMPPNAMVPSPVVPAAPPAPMAAPAPAPRLPPTGGMTLSDAATAYQGGGPVGQALSRAAPKAAPKAPASAPRPGGGRPAPKRAENKERTAKRKARTTRGNQG